MDKHINSNGICRHCDTKSIYYSILNGNFTYYCIKCNVALSKDEVLTDN